MVVGQARHEAEAVSVTDTAVLLCVVMGHECDGSEPCRPICYPPPPAAMLPPFED